MTSTTVLSYLRARAAEPSTKAGLSAFAAALGAGLATVGSPRAGLVLFAVAALSGLNAMLTADPQLAGEVRPLAAGLVTLEPVLAGAAEAAAPKQAATIAAVAAGVKQAAESVAAGGAPAPSQVP